MSKGILGFIVVLVLIIIVEAVFLFQAKKQVAVQSTPAAIVQSFSKGLDNVYVQVRIKETVGGEQFTDSLYYTAEEWSNKTAEEIKKTIQDRVSKWTNVTATPAGQ